MKIANAWILVTTVALSANASDIAGNWETRYTGGTCYKTIGGADFDFKVDGDNVTGTANVGNWPGPAPISEGNIEGDHISFIVFAKRGWTRTYQGVTTSGMPKMIFTGTIHGSEIALTMDFYNDPSDAAPQGKVEFKGKRTSPK